MPRRSNRFASLVRMYNTGLFLIRVLFCPGKARCRSWNGEYRLPLRHSLYCTTLAKKLARTIISNHLSDHVRPANVQNDGNLFLALPVALHTLRAIESVCLPPPP